METQRIILYGALLFTLYMIWEAWQIDYVRPKPEPTVAATAQNGNSTHPSNTMPTPTPSLSAAGNGSSVGDMPSSPDTMKSAERVTVKTDKLEVQIDTIGGGIRDAALLEYPVAANKPDEPMHILSDQGGNFLVAQSGLVSANSGIEAPTHYSRYQAEKSEYSLADGEDNLTVDLFWKGENGLEVVKRYTFHRGTYVVDLEFLVRNSSADTWQGHMYRQLNRNRVDRSMIDASYTGGVIYSEEEKYEKITFDDIEDKNLSRTITGGWAAMIQHYFLSAWIPNPNETNNYYTKSPGNDRYILGLMGAANAVPAGGEGQFSSRFYVGPKLQDHLAEVAPGLELTVDYGVLTIIAEPLFWLLKTIHNFVGNWGWAIIILTILIKAVFYKLSETSYKSMAHMRKVQPRMVALKERYADNKEKLNEAMMKLYKEEKINPLGGCLPILVQIPVFIALYWVLLESVELRHADFMFWLNDLSSKDPYYILPLLMGATMLIQHRLNPTPMDPMQARIMMMLPIVFTFFFAFFPAGLVLYWVVNNTLSIAQQWYITRHVVKA